MQGNLAMDSVLGRERAALPLNTDDVFEEVPY